MVGFSCCVVGCGCCVAGWGCAASWDCYLAGEEWGMKGVQVNRDVEVEKEERIEVDIEEVVEVENEVVLGHFQVLYPLVGVIGTAPTRPPLMNIPGTIP